LLSPLLAHITRSAIGCRFPANVSAACGLQLSHLHAAHPNLSLEDDEATGVTVQEIHFIVFARNCRSTSLIQSDIALGDLDHRDHDMISGLEIFFGVASTVTTCTAEALSLECMNKLQHSRKPDRDVINN
jgi:hypothetical protein